MSKSIAILVLDYTPDYCNNCPCFYDETEVCQVPGVPEFRVPYDEKSWKNPRPDWCPLHEAPEYEPIWYDDQRSDYKLGWNACLDNILGVKEDE